MKTLKKERTLGYHANEEELDDKRDFNGCVLILHKYGEGN